ncbi:carotenoid biosynthesis protein [Adhaeribacter radiodurans]|uniref:Carotenoid biosynthesis protein n=1 Tax=Adhaeribacter radiodurans TaxID=2745197 RepID=A0A7L7LDV6_9BACT|nr:carotenoid biosynthesis protein [Adhaeribacter radiodurans]QMU30963.1 carotenoid biosynthesis protein [Adhaeribacter radiodurans]
MNPYLPVKRKELLAIFVLVIFYAVGFYGLVFSNYQALFLSLVPFNLLLTNLILFFFHQDFSRPFWLFAFIVFSVGFLAEVIGIHTALLFGHYTYGAALGWQLFKVPLIIGLNWLMLVYTAGHTVNYLGRFTWWIKAVLGAALMVALDYFIEPVAVHLDFWSWQANVIPLSNFVGWFLVALVLQIYFQQAAFRKTNSLAPFVFLLQFLFFGALSWVI